MNDQAIERAWTDDPTLLEFFPKRDDFGRFVDGIQGLVNALTPPPSSGTVQEAFTEAIAALRDVSRDIEAVQLEEARHHVEELVEASGKLNSLVDELCTRIDCDAEDVGTDVRPADEILAELGPAWCNVADSLKHFTEPST